MCAFDELFCYVLPGWEGSAHDSRVLQAALGDDLVPLPGSYYLIDAGYGLRSSILPQKLFNLRHAQLRNVVKRIFGVLKRRFCILRAPPEYPYATQVKLVFALTALHNFIRKNNDDSDSELELNRWRNRVNSEVHSGNSSQVNTTEMDTSI